MNDAEFREHLRQEFGFASGLVRVQQFSLVDDDYGFWVGPLPFHYDQFLTAPEEYTREEQAEHRESIREFIARGVCVLGWCNDWWVLETDGVEEGWNLPEGGDESPNEVS